MQLERATLLKVTLVHGCFPHLLNCAYGTKSCKTSHIIFLQRDVAIRFDTDKISIFFYIFTVDSYRRQGQIL